MTYAAETSLVSRVTAVLGSAAIHAAVGLALYFSLPPGIPDTGRQLGERGEVLIVELVPLPDGGAPSAGNEDQQPVRNDDATGGDQSSGERSAPDRAGVAHQIGTPPSGDGGDADTGGGPSIEDTLTGAPTLSGAEVQEFRSRLLRHIERFRRYPLQAREAGHQGVVRIQFVMDQGGNITEAWVELSSGSILLDEEALAAIMRAQPLPAPPANWPSSFAVALPIGFSLR